MEMATGLVKYHECVKLMIQEVDPLLPLYLFSHSLGSAITITF
jgi:alpha-beta hydrolase superfamily lysophospholipase